MKEMIYSDKRKEEILEQGCYKGYKYVILNLGTHPTAYVENKLYVNSYMDDKLTDIDVHGGFTYLGHRLFHRGDVTEYIGWDYAHCDDFCGSSPEMGGKCWTTEEIQRDVFMVIDQLIEKSVELRMEGTKMKNKEKFVKEIAELAIQGEGLAVDKQSNKIVPCGSTRCVDCLFYGGSSCQPKILDWANAEYKEPKQFTEREKAFIKLFPEIKYVARDKYGDLFAYTDKPQKDEDTWDYVVCNDPTATLKHITLWGLEFNAIQWEDEEPTSREEILKEEK